MSGYNMDTLSQVRWGDPDGLNDFLFENGIQHQSFAERLQDVGFQVEKLPGPPGKREMLRARKPFATQNQ